MPRDRRHGEQESRSEETEDSGWLLDGLAIRPPLEEFRRLFEMKKRAFEGKVDAESLSKYEQARKLGEKFISEQETDSGNIQGGDSC